MRLTYPDLIDYLLNTPFEYIDEISGHTIYRNIGNQMTIHIDNNIDIPLYFKEFKSIPITTETYNGDTPLIYELSNSYEVVFISEGIYIALTKDFTSAIVFNNSNTPVDDARCSLYINAAIASIKKISEINDDNTILVTIYTDGELPIDFSNDIDYIYNNQYVYFIIPNYKQYIEFVKYIIEYTKGTKLEDLFSRIPINIDSLKLGPTNHNDNYHYTIKEVPYDITTLKESMEITFDALK